MPVDVIVGLQWGDEGKGKIVDLLSPSYDIVARFQGGPNAGHTLVINKKKYVLHTIPSGIIHEHTINVIGNGLVIDPVVLKKEIEILLQEGVEVFSRLLVSKKAQLILPTHKALDVAYEKLKGSNKIGSTLKGIGPTYQDKVAREGLRIGSILEKDFEAKYSELKNRHFQLLKQLGHDSDVEDSDWLNAIEYLRKLKLIQSEYYLNDNLKEGKKILAEGAQGTLLDIDFGTFPYVTSSNTISAGACVGLGLAPRHLNNIMGVFKAYTTRVGGGPFPTELTGETGMNLQKAGNEFGSTTGRARRCGWLDIPALNYAIMLNGVNQLIITKLDVMSVLDEIKVCTNYKDLNGDDIQFSGDLNLSELQPEFQNYDSWNENISEVRSLEDLPQNVRNYVSEIEKLTETGIKVISTGPGREETFFKQ